MLTERGRDLWKVLLTIWSWEAVWVTEHIEPLPPMYHTECGEEFSPVMHCRACGQPAGIRDVRGTFGPSGGFDRSVPRATTRRRSAGGSPGPGLVPQTIELIGNRWSAAALAAAFLGARRFTDMLVMTGAPPTIVSDRLRTFCQMGVLEPVVTKAGSGRVEYRLTDKGRAFFPHVMVMLDWGDRWFRAPEGPATLLTHTSCGGEFHPVLRCSACQRELHGSQIQVGGDPPKGKEQPLGGSTRPRAAVPPGPGRRVIQVSIDGTSARHVVMVCPPPAVSVSGTSACRSSQFLPEELGIGHVLVVAPRPRPARTGGGPRGRAGSGSPAAGCSPPAACGCRRTG